MHRQLFLHRTILHQQGPEHQRGWPGSQLEHQNRWYQSHQTPGLGPGSQMHLPCWPLLRIDHRQLVPGQGIRRD